MGFSIKSTLRFAWETFKKRPWLFIGATAILAAVSIGVEVLTNAIDITLSGDEDQPTFVGLLVNLALGTLIGMGGTAFYLAAHDNLDTVELSSLWHPRPFWKYVATSILLGLAVGVGLLLLIVPGIILALMFMFSNLIVIDRELGPIDAMTESNRVTHGLGLVLILFLINLLGILAFVVGLLVSIPVTALAFMHAYRVLSGAAGVPQPMRWMPSWRRDASRVTVNLKHLMRGACYSAGSSERSAFSASAALRGLR
jgi:uncharacterized membrane protein